MSNFNPFFIPNNDKNCRLEELPNGIKLIYVLSCDKDYPHYSFISKGKHYVERVREIKYTNNMSNHIMNAYLNVKNTTMLELSLFKHQKLINKIKILQNNLNSLK